MTYESLSGASPQLINLPQASARSLVVISGQEETGSTLMELQQRFSLSGLINRRQYHWVGASSSTRNRSRVTVRFVFENLACRLRSVRRESQEGW